MPMSSRQQKRRMPMLSLKHRSLLLKRSARKKRRRQSLRTLTVLSMPMRMARAMALIRMRQRMATKPLQQTLTALRQDKQRTPNPASA